MKGKHHKHPPIKRPTRGFYHKAEWAIYGTTCGKIEALYHSLHLMLQGKYKLNYVDADHNVETNSTDLQIGKKKYHLSEPIHWNEYDDRLQPWAADATIVNGNHYPAERQIVVIDPSKKDSLERRLQQLTNIEAIIFTEESQTHFGFLDTVIKPDTKTFNITDVHSISSHISHSIKNLKPELKAVILAGGKSQRMGIDKSQITYHDGQDQQIHMANLCKELGQETFISKSHTEERDRIADYPVIKDKMVEMGPYGAIISAMMYDPDAAWLVLACDLPYMNRETIQQLINQRKSSSHATAYKLSDQKFPEPLITIYEPSIYQRMLRFLSLGYACPRKVLINSKIHILPLEDNKIAFNANTPEEMKSAQKTIDNIG